MKPRWKPIIIAVLVTVLVLALAGVALAHGLQGNGKASQDDDVYRGGGYGAMQAQGEVARDSESCDGSCDGETSAGRAGGPWAGNRGAGGQGSGNDGSCDGSCSELEGTSAQLSASEEEALLYMGEEEKLARDVYLVLYEKWGVDEFSKIAASESRHMESVKRLLDRYGLADPVGSNAQGIFTDPGLQALYDTLVARGSQSVTEAYKVGVEIEEVDIADLEELIEASTHRDITRVAQNLLRGSEHHLASFNGLLAE